MSKGRKDKQNSLIRVELKYCEHCGGLWIRQSGAGVYCERCQPKVADLPIPKRKTSFLRHPVGASLGVEDVAYEETQELDAVGGVA